ncbi:MAG: MerR family transcriptional regulator [Clostridia bacterium]|nr:MerR family transcriptional regulator [Clostridia bacterium]
MAISVGKLARMFKISRTTLLYYDSIGLLRPNGRSEAGYRLYNESDIERLKNIMTFREAGVPLEDISRLLNTTEQHVIAALLKRLSELNEEICNLKKQQNVIINMFQNFNAKNNLQSLDAKTMNLILNSAGITTDQAAERWHFEFEKHSPEQHRYFLQMLGKPEEEINFIQKRCQEAIHQGY